MSVWRHQCYREIRALIELCRDGRFYQDYDESMEVLGKADKALEALEALVP